MLSVILVGMVSQDIRFIGKGRWWHFRGMGPIAYLADFTGIENSIYGSIESFGLSGSSSILGFLVLRR